MLGRNGDYSICKTTGRSFPDGRLSNYICLTWVGLTTTFILFFGSSFAPSINNWTMVLSSQCLWALPSGPLSILSRVLTHSSDLFLQTVASGVQSSYCNKIITKTLLLSKIFLWLGAWEVVSKYQSKEIFLVQTLLYLIFLLSLLIQSTSI